MRKDFCMPSERYDSGVTNTLRIYPISGKMKTIPAYLPIQEEAMLPWIMYSISAPMP
mgnify:FL=1